MSYTYEELAARCKKIKVAEGVELAYEEAGEGDKVIISVQMGFGDPYYVRDFAKYGYHVYMIWNRGTDPSPSSVGDSGKGWYNAWADDVCTFADLKGIDKFVYAGSSHGSGTGWHLIWKHPERVTAFLALVCGPHNISESKSSFRDMMKTMGVIPNYPYSKTDDPAALARIEDVSKTKADLKPHQLPVNYGRPLAELETEENVQELLKTLKTPTLLLGGKDDPIARPDLMFRTTECMPNCKLVMYSGMSHNDVSTICKEECVAECLHFLKAVETNNGRIYLPIENE